MRWGGGIYNAMRSAQVYGLGMDSGDVPGLEGESGLSCLALRWEEALRDRKESSGGLGRKNMPGGGTAVQRCDKNTEHQSSGCSQGRI